MARSRTLFRVKWRPKDAPQRLRRQMDEFQRELMDARSTVRWAGPKALALNKTRVLVEQRDVNDRPLKRLHPTTLARKRAAGLSTKILEATGRMVDQLRFRLRSSRGGLFRVEGDRAEAARAHQEGLGPAYKVSSEPREWAGLSPSDVDELNKLTERRLEDLARRTIDSTLLQRRGSRYFQRRARWRLT